VLATAFIYPLKDRVKNQATDAALAAKEQVQQWSREATGSVQALAASGSESARRWGADVGATVAEATGSLQAVAMRGSQSVHHMAMDQQVRDKVLLGAAAVVLTTALGLAWLRRA
jgi:hypothetical protein